MFLDRHNRMPVRFKKENRYIFFSFRRQVMDPVFFYYWLRTNHELFLAKSIAHNVRESESEMGNAQFHEKVFLDSFMPQILELEVFCPPVALQADLNPLLRDIYSLLPFYSRNPMPSAVGVDIPKATDILGYLLRI